MIPMVLAGRKGGLARFLLMFYAESTGEQSCTSAMQVSL